jgi:hypothetical protein
MRQGDTFKKMSCPVIVKELMGTSIYFLTRVQDAKYHVQDFENIFHP